MSAIQPKNAFSLVRQAGLISGPVVFLLLLALLPNDFISADAYKVLAVAAWMIIWWTTEPVSMSVTALLPLVLFPFLGLMRMSESASPYANPIIFLFMGGFMIALALEKHRLHERIALNILRITGTSGNGIILGFMIATGFLSMWISNTATAMMMLPIATSVVNLLHADKQDTTGQNERNFALGLMLMIGYAATLGGLATIIGTPPNVVFVGLLDKFYNTKLDFARWMLVGVPVSITLLTSTYFIITRILYPNHIKDVQGSSNLIKTRLASLGPFSATEKRITVIFMLTSICWIFQEFFNTLLGADLLNDTNIAMCGGLLMFIVPSGKPDDRFILEWKDTRNMAWGILILFGGGLCLAAGLEKVGVIQFVGAAIAGESSYGIMLVFVFIFAGVVLSEFMSNVALVQIFVPVIFGISDALEVNPILLALPVTLSASIGFMFPVATPPNAIVFASGHIRMKDMVRAGFLLDVVSIGIILLASMSIVKWVYS